MLPNVCYSPSARIAKIHLLVFSIFFTVTSAWSFLNDGVEKTKQCWCVMKIHLKTLHFCKERRRVTTPRISTRLTDWLRPGVTLVPQVKEKPVLGPCEWWERKPRLENAIGSRNAGRVGQNVYSFSHYKVTDKALIYLFFFKYDS